MGKTIDKKVVEMDFDNRNFEKNVKTSISTIDKLKSKLNFSGMSKGLDELSKSANNVSFNGLTNGIDQVGLKFNAMYSMADQAMRNITNSIVNFGLNIGKQLIIDPKKLGFNEYELKMQSVQTIMASTGESLEVVNEYLKELNEYSDKTIYSFQDMTSNIGKFTNMGVKLDDAVEAIKGISNEAALSGANANEASRAMYNFAQALSAGYVKLIDWKSIENANMATKEFKEELIKTAVEMGTLKKANDDMYETLGGETLNSVTNFNDSLKDQWMTSEVLITTLKKYASEETDVGIRAKAAAQDVKTFSMLIDTLTEAVQSGWAESFEIIFGDFNEAKKLWTKVSDALGKVISGISDLRNKYLQSFLGRSFTKTYQSMVKAFSSIKDSTDGLKEAVKTVADYSKVVDEIINGIWGNGQARWDALSEAGYDWAHAQNLVNERLGFSLRRETQYSESTEQVAESTQQVNEATEDLIANLANAYKKSISKQKMNEEELAYLEQYNKLSTKQQEAIKQVVKLSDKLAMPVKELLHNMDEINGRWLLFESFGNIGSSIITIFKAIGKAWTEVFPPEEAGKTLFNITTAFYKLTRIIKDFLGEIKDDDGVISNAEHLVSIFKALFSIIGLIGDVIKGTLSIAFNILGAAFGKILGPSSSLLEVLDNVATTVYENVTKIRKYIKEESLFGKVAEGVAKIIGMFVDKMKEFIRTNTTAQKVLSKIKEFLVSIKNNLRNLIDQLTSADGKIDKVLDNLFNGLSVWLDGLKNTNNVPMYIINGLINGLTKGISKVYKLMSKIATNMISTFCKVLKIASPSKAFFSIGKFIMLGLVLGMTSQLKPLQSIEGNFLGSITNFGKSLKESVINIFKGIGNAIASIDYRKVLAVSLGGAFIYLAKRLTDTTDKILSIVGSVTAPLKSFAGLLDGVKVSVMSFMKDLGTAKKMEAIKDVIKGIALSMLMVAASMYIIAKIEPDRLLAAGIICGIMAAVLTSLYFLINKLATGGSGVSGNINAKTKKATFNIGPIIGLSVALLAMAIALKKLANIDSYELTNAIKGMAVVILSMSALLLALGKISKMLKLAANDLNGISKFIRKISTSMLLMLIVIKIASKITIGEVKQAIYAMGLSILVFRSFMSLAPYAGSNAGKVAGLLLSVSASMLMLLGVIRLAATLKPREVAKGLAAVSGAVAILGILMLMSKDANNAHKAAALIGAFSLSMLGIVLAIKILSGISASGVTKATIMLTAIGVVLAGLIAITKFSGKNATKAGAMLLMVSGALLILSGAIFILSTMDTKNLIKGTSVITVIGLLFEGLIKSTEKSKNATKLITKLLIAMSVLLGFVMALSLIKPEALLSATSAITSIMLSLAVLIKSAGKIDKKSVASLLVVSGILLVVLGILAVIISQLAKTKPKNALGAAASLSLLLVTMAGVLALMTVIGPMASKATTGLILFTVMTIIVASLGFIISQLAKTNPKKTIDLVQSISMLLITMTGVLAVLTLIGLGGPAALIGIGSLIALIAAFGSVLALFGFINSKLPDAAKFLESGMPILNAIGTAIGSFVGNIIAGFGKATMSLLPELGEALSGFMLNLTPFLEGSKMIPKDLAKKMGSLSLAVIELTVAEFVSSIGSIMSLRFSLAVFGKELSGFMENLGPFIEGAKKIKPEVSQSIKNLAGAVLALTAAEFLDAIPLIGKKSFEEFGASLSELGSGLSGFAKSVKNIKNTDQVKIASESLKLIADAASTIPNTGGLISAIIGDNKGTDFKGQMISLAEGLVGFIDKLNDYKFTKDSLNVTKIACKALKNIAEVASEVPNAGGLLAALVGDNPLDKFASQFPVLADGLVGFITKIDKGKFTNDSLTLVDVACQALSKLVSVAKTLPNAGGWLQKAFGSKNLGQFSLNLPILGKSLNDFVNNLDIKGKIDQVDAASEMVLSLSYFFKEGKNIKIDKTFFTKLSDGLSYFIKTVSDISSASIELAISNTQSIVNFVKTFKDIKVESISKLSTTLKDLGSKGIKGFISSFENKDYKETVNKAAKALGDSAINGLKSKVKKDVGTEIGKNFVEGFVNGIKANTQSAINASAELGASSSKSLKKSIKSKSPSKLTYELGKFFDLGFVNGIQDYAKNVYSVSNEVGETARIGLTDAVSRITDAISNDSDSQPIITPVLDLTNVESGANQIGSLLNNQNVSIGANLNAISAGIRMRNQNAATNNDVVNAIDKLKNVITDQQPGNTYNLNGISYNDDSPIASAVGELIKAIEIEGRV